MFDSIAVANQQLLNTHRGLLMEERRLLCIHWKQTATWTVLENTILTPLIQYHGFS